jgi:hypothetical protein
MTTETTFDLSPEQAKAELAKAMQTHGVTITTVFLPFSKVPADRTKSFSESVTWEYSVRKADKLVSQGLYSCGVGCAKYNLPNSPLIPKWNDKSIDATGFRKEIQASGQAYPIKVLPPDSSDILGSLLLDASSGSDLFEDFCLNYGYDTDSRKAEKTWLACRNTYVELVQIFGTDELSRLQEIAANM